MNYYGKTRGFSWFPVPDRLLERLPDLERSFHLELWLRLHSEIQHQKYPFVLLSDDQMLEHKMWSHRTIDATELSRGRKALKKLGLLTYRREGMAYRYFVCHPITGIALDPEQAKAEVQQSTSDLELEALRAEIAMLKQQQQAKSANQPATALGNHDSRLEDTGQVEQNEE